VERFSGDCPLDFPLDFPLDSVGNLKVSFTEKSQLQTGDSQSLSIHTLTEILSRTLKDSLGLSRTL